MAEAKAILFGGKGDCLDLFVINVSTDFASMYFIHFAKVLRTLLAPRSNSELLRSWEFSSLYYKQNKKGSLMTSFFIWRIGDSNS